MTICEKCWQDAGGDTGEYQSLLLKRQDNPCSPEQQAGEYASICQQCFRRTLHQHTGQCMNGQCPSRGGSYPAW